MSLKVNISGLKEKKKKKEKKRPDARRRRTIQTAPIYGLDYYWLRLRLGPAGVSVFAFFLFFFFFHAFWDKIYCYGYCSCTVHEQLSQSLTCQTIFSQSVHTVHCSRTHKFHSTFSLKMGLTVLFTHLKVILLQYFSIFNFQFQFSVFSCIQTDPKLGLV